MCYYYKMSPAEAAELSIDEAAAFLIYARTLRAYELLDKLTVSDFPHLKADERKKIVKRIKSLMLPDLDVTIDGNSKKKRLSNKELFELLSGKK